MCHRLRKPRQIIMVTETYFREAVCRALQFVVLNSRTDNQILGQGWMEVVKGLCKVCAMLGLWVLQQNSRRKVAGSGSRPCWYFKAGVLYQYLSQVTEKNQEYYAAMLTTGPRYSVMFSKRGFFNMRKKHLSILFWISATLILYVTYIIQHVTLY